MSTESRWRERMNKVGTLTNNVGLYLGVAGCIANKKVVFFDLLLIIIVIIVLYTHHVISFIVTVQQKYVTRSSYLVEWFLNALSIEPHLRGISRGSLLVIHKSISHHMTLVCEHLTY